MHIDVTLQPLKIHEWPANAEMPWLVTHGPGWELKKKYKYNCGEVAAMFYAKEDAIEYRGRMGGRVWEIGNTMPLDIEKGG